MKIIGTALAAIAIAVGALVLTQPAQAQEFPPCDPEAPAFPCVVVDGDVTCVVFEAGGECIPEPAPAPVLLGPLPQVIGDPQPWTDQHASFNPLAPFGPGGER